MQKIKQFLYLVKPFWCSSKAGLAWVLLVIILTLSLSTTWLNVLLADWNGEFYNALQVLDSDKIIHLLWQFILLVAVFILLVVFADFLRKKFRIRETSDSQQKSEAVGLFKWHRCESMGSCGSDDRKFSAAIYFWKLDRSWQRLFPKRSLRERDFKRDERHGGIEYPSQETLGNGRHVGREKCKWNLF